MSRFLAIDADHGSIHIAAGNVRGGSVRLDSALTVSVGEALTVANAADLGKQLRDALRSAGVAAAPVVAVVGRDRVIVKDFKIPKVSPAEEPNVVRFQASKEMSEAADSVILDYYTLERPEADGQIRAVTASVRKDVLAAYKSLCQAAGLKFAGLTARPVGTLAALDRAIASGAVTAPEAKRASVAILSRGEKWSELVIARDGQPVFWRAVTATALTSEPMLLGELRRNMAVYNGQTPQQPVEALYVVEAAGPASGWSGRIQAGLNIQVQAFDPLAGVDHDSPADARGHFAALAGVLQLKTQGRPLPVDFASPRQAVSTQTNKKRLVAAAASVAALLIVGGLGFGYIKVQQKQTQLAKLVREKSDFEKQRKDMEEDEKRIKALEDWDAMRVNWLDQMYDLAAMFPDPKGTRIESFRGDPLNHPKKSKIQTVAKITMKVQTNDGRNMDALRSAMASEKRYQNVLQQTKGNVATASSGTLNLSYELRGYRKTSDQRVHPQAGGAGSSSAGARNSDDSGEGFDGGFGNPFGGGRGKGGSRRGSRGGN